ncbi:hypothetical protein AYI68_g7709 [Smittium mucronatum]|uniref:Uncharacterized protein n=1 Tax=Smittium mucronatum TaxID=133383 RepID=A0A1R0GMX3_9FUNG|nr:hypothetical protein AYI68_g7709 [Smittium mucronatum]
MSVNEIYDDSTFGIKKSIENHNKSSNQVFINNGGVHDRGINVLERFGDVINDRNIDETLNNFESPNDSITRSVSRDSSIKRRASPLSITTSNLSNNSPTTEILSTSGSNETKYSYEFPNQLRKKSPDTKKSEKHPIRLNIQGIQNISINDSPTSNGSMYTPSPANFRHSMTNSGYNNMNSSTLKMLSRSTTNSPHGAEFNFRKVKDGKTSRKSNTCNPENRPEITDDDIVIGRPRDKRNRKSRARPVSAFVYAQNFSPVNAQFSQDDVLDYSMASRSPFSVPSSYHREVSYIPKEMHIKLSMNKASNSKYKHLVSPPASDAWSPMSAKSIQTLSPPKQEPTPKEKDLEECLAIFDGNLIDSSALSASESPIFSFFKKPIAIFFSDYEPIHKNVFSDSYTRFFELASKHSDDACFIYVPISHSSKIALGLIASTKILTISDETCGSTLKEPNTTILDLIYKYQVRSTPNVVVLDRSDRSSVLANTCDITGLDMSQIISKNDRLSWIKNIIWK